MTARHRAPLWWRLFRRIFFAVIEFDTRLAYYPARGLVAMAGWWSRPKARKDEVLRFLYVLSALGPQVYALCVFLFIRTFKLEWRVTSLLVIFYLCVIAAFHFRNNPLIKELAEGNASTARNYMVQFRTVKLMFVCWGVFIMGLVVFLP